MVVETSILLAFGAREGVVAEIFDQSEMRNPSTCVCSKGEVVVAAVTTEVVVVT